MCSFCISEILPDEKKGVLNLIWTYYTSTLAVSGCPEHVLSVYHHRLNDLPWQEFMPDMTDLDLMIQVYIPYKFGMSKSDHTLFK